MTSDPEMHPSPESLLVIWNRSDWQDAIARRYEKHGARVIVAENGYLGIDSVGHHLFALSLDHHNGCGRLPVGDGSRWARLGIDLLPWRKSGTHILVLPQRGIGPRGVAMSRKWPIDLPHRLQWQSRPVRMRPHPGRNKVPLEPDLVDCWCAVTWGSTAALKALVAGIPVIAELPGWIGTGAAGSDLNSAECPAMPERLMVFERLAWAQWSAAEIDAGIAFDYLLAL